MLVRDPDLWTQPVGLG